MARWILMDTPLQCESSKLFKQTVPSSDWLSKKCVVRHQLPFTCHLQTRCLASAPSGVSYLGSQGDGLRVETGWSHQAPISFPGLEWNRVLLVRNHI
eukprot:s393_g24.t1